MNVCYILRARGRNRVIASPRDVGSGGLITTSLANSRQLLSPTAHVAVRFGVSGDCDGFIRPYALGSQVPSKNLDFFISDPTVTVPTATQSQLFNDSRANIVSIYCQLALVPKNVCNHSLPARAITLHSLRQSRAGLSNTSGPLREKYD
jgi:hypothetical protein